MSRYSSTNWSLIHLAQGGDKQALEALWTRYHPVVLRSLAHMGVKGEEADDLAQEVFLRLFIGGALQRATASRGHFRGLLSAMVRNAFRDALRRRSFKKMTLLGDADALVAQLEGSFAREWVHRVVELGLERVAADNQHYADALRWSLLDGCSHQEVAERQGVEVDNVRNYVYRGKKKLRAAIVEVVREFATSEDEFQAEVQAAVADALSGE